MECFAALLERMRLLPARWHLRRSRILRSKAGRFYALGAAALAEARRHYALGVDGRHMAERREEDNPGGRSPAP